ncbi:LPS biosynthesis protein WbpP [Candidatus Woesearchaeota archaeon CG10_big_fil_rev_8_21_14_0_10_37_12]|nr:MAG: LPS biosynthesis protein WbpP [Candidatus Woesearchaeota archaeon CG10_big_fil_rev_8_21_14_0_10_37_12]
MKILVTGGAGFIGSHIVDALVQESHTIIVYDNLSAGKKENIAHHKNNINLVEADITDFQTLNESCQNVDVILHLAASNSVPRSLKEPEKFFHNNILGTYNVLEAARQNNVKRVIFSSSSSVYGTNQELPLKEEKTGMRLSPYAISKFTGEDLCKFFWKTYGMETVILRYFNVFGARQNKDSQYAAVIPKFITLMLAGKEPTIFGDGEQKRDFTHVSNVVYGNILALTAENIAGETINIANSSSTSVNQLIQHINKIIGKNIQPIYTPPRKGDIKDSLADTTKAKQLLGFKPVTLIENGLEETIGWFRKNKQ